ncbi:hypothetical protein GCM10025868_19290 [Angustibacter aerolatus]|uniref:GGDEF domain-containing protein n=1 Tax=Angustibacter aerolatus TaxID=1162965 RepID=A0ABQ6JH33_9ACTN|nr:diguanylate cyclase [Angustibacter aerolatus]GMA86679.1 hypothetical protein GCM10025868_19290 [Angustibacter aerolatus]
MLFCDLDGLKYVNDTYGHLAGDRLIRTAVDRVRAALRPADVLARIGGDEFVVLLEDLATADAAAVVAQRVLQEVAAPWQLDGHDQRLSMSIGVAVTDDPAAAGDALISHADAAMYRAKRAGPGRAEVFDSKVYAADRAASEARERFADDLRDALDAGRLEVHYQPVVHLTEHDPGGPAWGDPGLPHGGHPVHAVEALLRWRHPTRGLLVADDFIATAARSGLLPQPGAVGAAQRAGPACATGSGPGRPGARPRAGQRLCRRACSPPASSPRCRTRSPPAAPAPGGSPSRSPRATCSPTSTLRCRR